MKIDVYLTKHGVIIITGERKGSSRVRVPFRGGGVMTVSTGTCSMSRYVRNAQPYVGEVFSANSGLEASIPLQKKSDTYFEGSGIAIDRVQLFITVPASALLSRTVDV